MTVNLSHFKTIIFDFGGVIFDIDPQRTITAFENLVGAESLKKVEDAGLFIDYEKGNMDSETFYNQFCTLSGGQMAFEVFKRAWCAMLVGYQHKRIERIQLLRKSHKLIMLSNTNELHYNHFSAKLEHDFGVSFTQLFHKVYLSHQMGLIKPDKEIYKQVLVEQNLMPEKTLFIEDTKANADAARELGIETLVIPRNGSFYTYFEVF